MVTKFKKKKQVSRAGGLWLALGLLVLFGGCLFLLLANWRLYQTRKELQGQTISLQKKADALRADNERLEAGIAQSSNQQYIEKVAREELDLQKPGETVVSFVEPEAPALQPIAEQQNVIESWLGFLGNLFQ